jgi:hypothetical protein
MATPNEDIETHQDLTIARVHPRIVRIVLESARFVPSVEENFLLRFGGKSDMPKLANVVTIEVVQTMRQAL